MERMTIADRTDRADAFALVRTQSASMPTSMRAIADAVLDDPGTAATTSAAELADRAGVSPATVSRFAQHLGFANFAALQRSMTRGSSGASTNDARPRSTRASASTTTSPP